MNREQLTELLYQGLETEMGGTMVYETALRCVLNDELKEEWEEYLEQTKTHVQVLLGVFMLSASTRRPPRLAGRSSGTSVSRS